MQQSILKRTLLVALSAIAAVSICAAVLTAQPAQAKDVQVKTCGGGSITLKAAERNMLNLHNKERVDRGKRKLCINPKLQRAARAHAQDMIKRDYFSHDTKGTGESFSERLTRFGYDWSTCAENIVRGSGRAGSASNMFDAWMESSGHRANIVDGSYRQVGIAVNNGWWNGTPDTNMWVADFATPR